MAEEAGCKVQKGTASGAPGQGGQRPAVRGRFAPSPSGRMHLGNVFCALLAWLSVRAQGGTLVLRIEDLDPGRCKPAYTAQLEDDLRWLGLDWDEGDGVGGPDGPYRQSLRTPVYADCLEALSKRAQVYACYCKRSELHAAQAPHASDGTPVYSGRCRALSPRERAEQAQRRAPSLRLRVPEPGQDRVAFTDGHLGPYAENLARDCGDFIIRRSDGVYAYQFAVVADDAAMGITEVVRGRDLLSSTPRQLYLYRLLGKPAPRFYHIPLLVTAEGRRLSKRDRGMDLGYLRQRGWHPEEILGRLAQLGGLLPSEEAISAYELARLFDWSKIPVENIVVPEDFLNGFR